MGALIPLVISFLTSAAGTALVLLIARRFGWLARPRPDRWHERPTALFGGVAIFLAFAGTALWLVPMSRELTGLLVGTGLVFIVGLIDDAISIKPYAKLIGQIAAACVLVASGVHVGFSIHPMVAIPVTVLWVVGITNAFNLLDNMDGLSAGVAVISATLLFLFTGDVDAPVVGALALALAGAAAGFLLFNFNPARIFMGDCGSMTLGFVLAAVSIMGTWQQAGNLFLILAVPVLILAVPIFDTTLVTVIRSLSGRRVSQGGRDHSSHRLVALGLSERAAVLLLWLLCATFGAVAFVGYRVNLYAAAVAATLLVIGIFFFGVFLGQVPIYRDVADSSLPGRHRPALINTLLLHKRRIVEVAVDFVLVCLAYISAYLLRFDGVLNETNLRLIYQSLPVLIVIKMSAFYFFGLYRGVWRYVGMTDALNIVKGVVTGSLVSALVLVLAYRFEGYSRSVLILDGLLLLFFVAGVRALLRVFREAFSVARPAAARNILIAGAGDGGEMLLREIRSNAELGYRVVGFVDDDPEKHGRMLHGTPVLGSVSDIKALANRNAIEEVLIAIPRASGEQMRTIIDACQEAGVPFQTSPRLSELIDGTVRLAEVRNIDVRDLLGRAPLPHEPERLREAVQDRRVLVTGAGGTLGSELLRRAHAYGAARVLAIDQDDNALRRLSERMPAVEPVLLDVAGEPLEALIEREKPDIVIHAAAVTQVALLEKNALGAVRTNVIGTRAVARACARSDARLILVSSTRAVRPANIAVATRRLAEEVARSLAGSRLTVVRLPNILGARGGVLQRFREQARQGEPLTVTDERAARRFVTVAEAAALVLEAASLDVAPPIFLQPSGLPELRIVDVAAAVLQVAGRPDDQVTVTGLRAGETSAEPWPAQDTLQEAGHPHLKALDVSGFAEGELSELMARLESALAKADERGVRRVLCDLVDGESSEGSQDNVVELQTS